MPGLLDHRLIFVTGKGGVGKSVVATSIGLLCARRGARTIVAELSGQRRVQHAFGTEAEPFAETELAPGLSTISIDPQRAMEEYLRLRTGALGQMLASSRLFGAFAMATPGMRELLSIGKVWELAQLERRTRDAGSYDVVIVDAPATGHGVGILRTPRTFAEIARVGPIAHQGARIADTIADRSFTALVAVSTAEEMPVNETLAIRELLSHDGLALNAVVLNALYPQRFSDVEAKSLATAQGKPSAARKGATAREQAEAAGARTALRAALSEHTRAKRQSEQARRLRAALSEPAVELPYLFAADFGLQELEQLADSLGAGLEASEQRPAGPAPAAERGAA